MNANRSARISCCMNCARRILPVVLAAVILFCVPANRLSAQGAAPESRPLSLADAVETALERNFQIRIAKQREAVARNNNAWGNAGRFPTIELRLDDGNSLRIIDNPASFLNGTVSQFGATGTVEARWTVFNNFSARINKERLSQLEEQAGGNADILVQNTVQAVLLAYYRALAEQERLKALEEAQKLSRARLDYEETRKEFGASTTYDRLQAKSSYLSDRQNYFRQEINAQNAVRELLMAMGAPQEDAASYRLTDTLRFEPQTYDYEELRQLTKQNNVDLRNEYLNREILQKDYELSRAPLFPRVDLVGGSSANINRIKINERAPAGGQTYDFYLNFAVSYTLFDGGNVKRRVQNAEIQQRIQELTIDDLQLSLDLNLQNELNAYRGRVAVAELARENVETSAQLMQIAEERFKTGTINSLDYRQLQVALLNARMDYYDAVLDALTSETELARLTGNIVRQSE